MRAHKCSSCDEIMPCRFRVCYCGGAVKQIEAKKDEYPLVASYEHRKWLAAMKQKEGRA